MRKVLSVLAMMLASGSAMASSIEHIHGDRTSNDSVISISCAGCTPKVEAAVTPTPALQPGTQTVSLRETGGRKQAVRTEAWFGGAPVTYVSANPVWLATAQATAALAAQQPAPVDTATMTSAVDGTPAAEQTLDYGQLERVAQTPLRPGL